MSANSRGLMRFEHTREKVEGDDQNETEPGMWQVNFSNSQFLKIDNNFALELQLNSNFRITIFTPVGCKPSNFD